MKTPKYFQQKYGDDMLKFRVYSTRHEYRRLHSRIGARPETRQPEGGNINMAQGAGTQPQKGTMVWGQRNRSEPRRDGFNALEKAIFAGTVKTVVVWKLDRIAHSMRDGINTLSNWCESGVRVVSVTQQIDLSGTVGHLVAGVLFGIAEIELQNSKEWQAAGIAVAKSKGVYKGRKKGTTKAKPERARKLKAQGLKTDEIASALGVTERTVFRYLGK